MPLETLLSLAPAGLIALWAGAACLRRHGRASDHRAADPAGRLPAIGAPHSHVRYLVPLYPLARLVIASRVVAGGAVLATTRKWVIG
jgi:hypothetical protein